MDDLAKKIILPERPALVSGLASLLSPGNILLPATMRVRHAELAPSAP